MIFLLGSPYWMHLKQWSNYPEDYTVTTSSDVSKKDGAAFVKKAGKYLIYYKVTAACWFADGKNKT